MSFAATCQQMVKTDDIKTEELLTTSTSTYILNQTCTQTMTNNYKQMVQLWRGPIVKGALGDD